MHSINNPHRIFHDIVFENTEEGDDTPIISDAYVGDFDLENDSGDKDFKLMFSVKGKQVYHDTEEGEIISKSAYDDKEDQSMCESTYDVVHQYNLEELSITTVGYNKRLKKYMKNCMKKLDKGPVKKALKTYAGKVANKDADGFFYHFVKKNKDNITFFARQGTEKCADEGDAMIVVCDMEDWKAPTYYFFGPGLQGKSC